MYIIYAIFYILLILQVISLFATTIIALCERENTSSAYEFPEI